VKEVPELPEKAGVNAMDCFKNEIIRAPRISYFLYFLIKENLFDKKFLEGYS
jgi:hypothetical protein